MFSSKETSSLETLKWVLLPSGTWDAFRYWFSLIRGCLACGCGLSLCRLCLHAGNTSVFGSQELGVPVTHSNVEVVCGSDVVFVAVKPHLVQHVLGEISQHVTDRHIIVSVAAGVTLATLEEVSVWSLLVWIVTRLCGHQEMTWASLSIASFYPRTRLSSGWCRTSPV